MATFLLNLPNEHYADLLLSLLKDAEETALYNAFDDTDDERAENIAVVTGAVHEALTKPNTVYILQIPSGHEAGVSIITDLNQLKGENVESWLREAAAYVEQPQSGRWYGTGGESLEAVEL